MKDEEDQAPDEKNQEEKNNVANESEEIKEENGEQKQNNQESEQDSDVNKKKDENAGKDVENNENVAAQKDNIAAQKENAKKGKDQLKVILPPQNPEGPGERGEAVQIKDPDPDTKAKIGKTFNTCFHSKDFEITELAFFFFYNKYLFLQFFLEQCQSSLSFAELKFAFDDRLNKYLLNYITKANLVYPTDKICHICGFPQ